MFRRLPFVAIVAKGCMRNAARWACMLMCFISVYVSSTCNAQIGGKTADDGMFALDDVEDLNTTAGGLDRAWIPDYIYTNPNAFAAVPLSASALSLAEGQTSIGALRYAMPSQPKGGYISYSFGVPMPSQPGASTLTHPGDISSFTHLTFLARGSTALNDQVSQVILETYPSPTYPKIYWNFPLPIGSTFQRVSIPLREPDLVQNAGSYTIDYLLQATRYMSFYFYGGKQSSPTTLTVHVDDIRLVKLASAGVDTWSLY